MTARLRQRLHSGQCGMAVDVLALSVAIAGSLFFTTHLWTLYRQTISVTNLSVGLSSVTPLRPQVYTYDALGFILQESDQTYIKRLDSIVALLAGTKPTDVATGVPEYAVFACIARTRVDPYTHITNIDFPIYSSNTSLQSCNGLNLSSLSNDSTDALKIVIGSTRDALPIRILDHPMIGRPADRIYSQLRVATHAVDVMNDFNYTVNAGGNPF